MKIINILIVLILSAMTSMAATSADLLHGVDLTGVTNISGSLLNQLVDNSTAATNRGLIIHQAATPDTTTYPRFTNYLWIDISLATPTLKAWNGAAWVSAVVGAGTVGNAQLAGNSISSDKIQQSAINETNINDLAVTTPKIGAYQVVSSKIGAGAVGWDKLYPGAVNASILTNNAVVTSNITDLAVTRAKLALGAVDASILTNGAIVSSNIAALAVTSDKLATNSVDSTNIVAGAVTPMKLGKFDYALINADASIAVANSNIIGCTNSATTNYDITFGTTKTGTNYVVTAIKYGTGFPGFMFVTIMTTDWFRICTSSGTTGKFSVMVIDPQ